MTFKNKESLKPELGDQLPTTPSREKLTETYSKTQQIIDKQEEFMRNGVKLELKNCDEEVKQLADKLGLPIETLSAILNEALVKMNGVEKFIDKGFADSVKHTRN